MNNLVVHEIISYEFRFQMEEIDVQGDQQYQGISFMDLYHR